MKICFFGVAKRAVSETSKLKIAYICIESCMIVFKIILINLYDKQVNSFK